MTTFSIVVNVCGEIAYVWIDMLLLTCTKLFVWIHYTLFDIHDYIYSNNYELLPSYDTDHGIVERELDIKDSTASQLDESPCTKSLESLFDKVTSQTKTGHQSEIAKFYKITLSYISPQTKKLHSDILKNSPANLSHHNNNTIQVLRKSCWQILITWLIMVS